MLCLGFDCRWGIRIGREEAEVSKSDFLLNRTSKFIGVG